MCWRFQNRVALFLHFWTMCLTAFEISKCCSNWYCQYIALNEVSYYHYLPNKILYTWVVMPTIKNRKKTASPTVCLYRYLHGFKRKDIYSLNIFFLRHGAHLIWIAFMDISTKKASFAYTREHIIWNHLAAYNPRWDTPKGV